MMGFTMRKKMAVTLAVAMFVSLMPGNIGMAEHSGKTGYQQSKNVAGTDINADKKELDIKQDASKKKAGEENPAATEKPVVKFSKGSGTYSKVFNLELSYAEDASASIYYTTDGSNPADPDNANRMLYTADGIAVQDRKNDPNVLAAIDPILFDSVNVKVSKGGKGFESTIDKPADKDVDKCTVIKAAAQLADGSCSAVTTNTYFIGEMADHIEGIRESVEAAGMDLSVMSISMDAEDLFDSAKGIYVKGDTFDKALEEYLEKNGELWDKETCRDLGANYKQKGRDWERSTHIDYFESDGTETTCELQQDCGIRIQGNYSRSDYQKSFRLYARDDYGKKNFKYGFWDNAKDDAGNTIEKYKKIVLRNGGNCAFTTKFSDSYWQSLIEDIACDKQHARPCVVYLNGEYWGVYILQDDFCGAYMENKHGIDKDNILIYKGDAEAIPDLGYKLDEGELPAGVTDENYYFQDLEDFMRKHNDLSKKEDFDAFCELIDKDSALDYFATQVWINNKWDWPGKNWSMWRCTDAAIDPSNPYADGKWRFLIYDVEFGGVSGSGDARSNTVRESKLLTTGVADIDTPNFDKPNVRCFALLMTNKDFRDAFNARVESFSDGMFEQEHALAEAERYGKIYEPILGQFFDRFPTQNNSVDNAINGGYASLRCITDFLKKRASYIPTITKWVRKQFGDPEPAPAPTATPSSTPQNTPQPPADPKPTTTPTDHDTGMPLPPDQRDLEIPLEDGSVKILHVNYIGTKVLYTAYRVEGVTYRLKSDGTFSYMAKNAEKMKKKKSIVIADTVVAGGKRYKVTEIEDGALQGLKKLQKVTIGENVKLIGKNAFKNCKKLKQLVLSGTKLKKIGKNAFKGTAKKLKVSCLKKKKKAYQKLIKKSGRKAKTIQIKKLSFKRSNKQAAEAKKNNSLRKSAGNETAPVTMTSLKKADGSYTDAEAGAIVSIASAEELKMLSEYTKAKKRTEGVTFRQTADIDGTGVTMHGIGEVAYRLVEEEDEGSWYEQEDEQFCGTYDGGSKKISNLNIAVAALEESAALDENADLPYYLGLFSRVNSATIQNIDLRSIRFVDEKSGEVFEAGKNMSVSAAGIVGYAEGESSIFGCSNYADITVKAQYAYAYGICAQSDFLKIRNCHNYGKITVEATEGESQLWAAGVCRSADESISGCSNAGVISASVGQGSQASGLFNDSYGDILDCTNTGTVTAVERAAGICGNCYGEIRRCANSGDISAEGAAGIIYSGHGAVSVFDCSNSGKISGKQYAGGIMMSADYATLFGVSNTGEVNAEKWAGGMIAKASNCTIGSAENFAKITSQDTAGGAVGYVIGSELVNIWNHGEISGDAFAGGIAGSVNTEDRDYDYDKAMEPCAFMNCIHLGTLTGEGNKGAIIAYSDQKDEFKHCYVSEESTDPANASDSSITAKKISKEAWKQADFMDELNQNLSDINSAYALSVKYDAESGIQWTPAIILNLFLEGEGTLSENPMTFQIKDIAGAEYTDMRMKGNGYLAEIVPGHTYEIYYLMENGSRRLMKSEICLAEGDSAYITSLFFGVFLAYTDATGEERQDEDGDPYIEFLDRTLYDRQYYQEPEEVKFPSDPTKEGWDFEGWYSDPGVCSKELYAIRKKILLDEYKNEYQGCIEMWDYISEWLDEYASAEEYAASCMENSYGYATFEAFEQHYDEYYEKHYRVTELLEEDDYELSLRANTIYAKWTKKGGEPTATPVPKPGTPQATQKPEPIGGSYSVLKNLQQYKDKLGAYVQKKGVIYKVNAKKKTAAVVGVSSKMVTAVTVQSTVKTGGVNYKVTAINKRAFTGCKQLKKIRIKGKNLKKVDKKALQGAAKKIKISASAKIKKLF